MNLDKDYRFLQGGSSEYGNSKNPTKLLLGGFLIYQRLINAISAMIIVQNKNSSS